MGWGMLSLTPYIPFVLVCFLTLPRILTQSFILLAIPFLIRELNLTDLQAQFLFPTLLAGVILFLIPAGKIGDILGSRKTLILSSYVFVIGALVAGFTKSVYLFFPALFLLGATAAFSMTQGSAYITEIFPFRLRGRIIGLFTGLISLSFFMGPVLGGLIAHLGQKGVFLTMLPFFILALLLSNFLPKVQREDPKIVKIEYKDFLQPSFLSHCFISLFWQSIISLLIFFPAEFQLTLGYSPFEAGILFAILALPFPVFSPVAGWIFDRLGSRIPYSIGYISLGIGWILSYYRFDNESLVVLAFALAFVIPVTASASWGFFNQKSRSTATSIYYLLRFFGSIIGSLIAGYLLVQKNLGVEFFLVNYTLAIGFALLSAPAFYFAWKNPGKK
jgi:MFS family permease